MKSIALLVVFFLCSNGGHALAQNIDCSSIKNNPPSYKRCMDAQREAAKHEKEKKKQERLANLRDAICVADAVGGDVAALKAGWAGKVVYKGTRAAADAISKGASRCPG